MKRTAAAAPPPGSPPEPRRFCSISDVMRRCRPVGAPPPVARARHEVVLCEACGAGDRDEELLLCDLCDRGRHTFCLRPILAAVPLGPWLCPDCALPPKPIIRCALDPKGEAVPLDLAANKPREEPNLDHGRHRVTLFFGTQTGTADGYTKALKEEPKAKYDNAIFMMQWMFDILSEGK